MADDLREFANRCRTAGRGLRRVPTQVRRDLVDQVTPEIAQPLAADIAAAFRGPWAAQLATGTKARRLAEPTIVVGGARRVVSGGAGVRDLVFGAQFGGGKKITTVHRKTRHGSTKYKAHTTRQFSKPAPTIFPTIRERLPWVLDEFARLVLNTVNREMTDG